MPPSFKGGPCIRKICCGRSAFFLAQTGPPVPVHKEAQHEGRENAITCHKMLQPPCQAIQTNSKRVKGWKIKTRKAMMSRRQIKIDQVSFLCSNRFSFCWLPSMLSAHLWLAWQICKLPTAGQWSIETRQVPASSHGCSKIYCGLFNLHIGTISDTCVMPCALGPGLFPLF